MKKKALALLLSLLLILAFAACGASKSASMEASYGTAQDAAAPAAEENGFSDKSEAGGISSGETQHPTAVGEDGVPTSDKIIYSAYAEIETRDFETSLAGVSALIERYGGFLENSSVTGNDYNSTGSSRSAHFVVRVPSQHFEELTGSLSELGNVPYSSTNAENITAQYNDTQSRLEAYQIEYDRLLSMLEKAATVEDMLAIESRLSDVRYNIESLSNTISGWDSLLSYSTVEIQLREVVSYSGEPADAQSYWAEVGAALSATLKGVGSFFKGLLKTVIAFSPVLIILVVAAAVALLSVRGVKRRRAAKLSPPENSGEGKK